MSGKDKDISDLSLQELFQIEADEQCRVLSDNLLRLEKNPADQSLLESLMRAAHSLKGAARIINLQQGVDLSHAIEDIFVAAQKKQLSLSSESIDVLLSGVDLLHTLAQKGKLPVDEFHRSLQTIKGIINLDSEREYSPEDDLTGSIAVQPQQTEPADGEGDETEESDELALRVSSAKMTKLLGLASEIKIESRWLPSFSLQLLQLKYRQDELYRLINQNREAGEGFNQETLNNFLQEIQRKTLDCRVLLSDQLAEAEEHARRGTDIAHRLYHEILNSKMVPFNSGVEGLPRMVRDLARELGKKAELQIIGRNTRIDRDILHKMEMPLNHLIRNAVDHGLESPEERKAAGKDETGVITINAYHQNGMLHVDITDDGRGIEHERIREKVINSKMVGEDIAANLSDKELLDFLFLPNFSTRQKVSSVSGRGVGLDVVHTAVRSVRGNLKVSTVPGSGTSFEMQLPLTLSVMRSLMVSLNGEPYAFPVVVVDHVLRIYQEYIKEVEGKPYIIHENKRVGLVSAAKLFGYEMKVPAESPFHIVVLSNNEEKYGLIVDSFVGIQDLVVQAIDRRLGKIKDISAVALLENGTPVLILDAEDLIRSMDKLIGGHRLLSLEQLQKISADASQAKRILVVDDSITVREVEREMLLSRGYRVEIAVDGQEAWNAIRSGAGFDLVVTDVDMPRMNGLELVQMIKEDPVLAETPVIIVSYKDREEDRERGLEVGADYYLAKGSFQDEMLVEAVKDLIGEPLEP